MSEVASPPEAGPGVARMGDNRRDGYADTRDEFVELITNQLKGLDVWEKRDALDDDLAKRALDFQKGLKKLKKEGDEARKAEKRPHDDAVKAVDAWWKTQLDKIDKAIALVTPKLDAYLKEKERQRQAAAEAAREAAAEAERRAEELRASTPYASTASARIEQEAMVDDAVKAAKDYRKQEAQASGPARVESATGLANKTGMRTVWDCEVTDARLAILYFLKTNPDEVAALAKQLAGQHLRASDGAGENKQVPVIPGVTVTSKKEFK